MKKSAVFALVAVAGTTAAFAGPRESATFTGLVSDNLQGAGTMVTATFNGSDAGGTYNATYLTISGQYTVNTAVASYGSEASILVTPPTGNPFIINVFAFAGFPAGAATQTVPAGAYVVPVSAITTAGTWSFEFFESFNDGTAGVIDGTWDNVTITMQDGAAPTAPAVSGPNSATYSNVPVDGLAAAPAFTATFSAPAGPNVLGYRLVAQATATNADGTANLAVNATPVSNIRVEVTPPGGAPIAAQIFGANAGSTTVGEISIQLPASINPAGDWTIKAYTADDSPGVDAVLNSLGIQLLTSVPTPSIVTDLGTLVPGTPANTTVAGFAAGQTKWVKFTLDRPVARYVARALSIDTEGSTTTPTNNTSVGLYAANGTRVATDFSDGTDSIGTLSFGLDTRPAPGNGVAYNGRDGGVPAGVYYVAMTVGDTGVGYGPGFFTVTNTSTGTGDVNLTLNLLDPSGTLTTGTPPEATDLGTLSGNNGAETVTTVSATLAASEIKWWKFTTAADATAFNSNYVDIDSEGSTLIDTELGVFTSTGVLVASDDDDGSGNLTALSFGAGGRPAVGGGAARNGRDGLLLAGTYYVAGGDFNMVFADGFAVTTGVDAGDITLNIRTNLSAPGSSCGPADIGSTGGTAGFDNRLDNNDFIVFIDRFFANAASADIGTTGGAAGSDGLWNNNDFIVFIDQFFQGPASCR